MSNAYIKHVSFEDIQEAMKEMPRLIKNSKTLSYKVQFPVIFHKDSIEKLEVFERTEVKNDD